MEGNKNTMSRRNIFKSSPERINEILSDTELRIECRWMLCYMLSFHECHEFNIPEIMEEQGFSKNRMYKILDELIELRYLKRERTKDQSGQLTFRYLVSDTKGFFNFQERCPQNEDPQNEDGIHILSSLLLHSTIIKEEEEEYEYSIQLGDPQNEDITREIEKSTVNLTVKPEEGLLKKKKEELHLDAVDVMLEMLNILKIRKPNMKDLNLEQKEKMSVSVSEMLTKEEISRERILSVFTWSVNDEFWSAHMFVKNPAKYLMQKFDRLEVLSWSGTKKTIKEKEKEDKKNKEKLESEIRKKRMMSF